MQPTDFGPDRRDRPSVPPVSDKGSGTPSGPSSAASKRVWKHGPAEGTTGWHGRFYVGRLQIGWHLYQHSSRLGDRWVLQPFLIYDRRPA